ncbi:hypothetical protein MMC17_002288 [Xylographa soralifera]|nr:hypothetical protein [Xylographa soralifera]
MTVTGWATIFHSMLSATNALYSFWDPSPGMEAMSMSREMSHLIGILALSLAAYNVLAAWQDNRAYYILTICLRAFFGTLFYRAFPPPMKNLIVWEYFVGGSTVLGLAWEGRLLSEKPKPEEKKA